MKKVAIFLVILMTALLVTQNANADDRHKVKLDGVITAINDHGIVLKTRRGEVKIRVTPDTRIMRNGERVRFGALRVRDKAAVVAKIVRRGSDRKHLVALGIHARGNGK